MGQAMQKFSKKEAGTEVQKQPNEDARKIIESYIDAHYDTIKIDIQKKDGFYHVVYEIVEHLSEKSGAMQFKLPPKNDLETAYNEVCGVIRLQNLNKDEFRKIIVKVVKFESFYMGQGAKDVFLYIFGVPFLALLAKRLIPGPTRAIPDDVLIPFATSGTVVVLARNNRL